MKRIAIIVASGLLIGAGAVSAQDTSDTSEMGTNAVPSLSSLDRDLDGAVSETEAQAAPEVAAVFAKADADKNGKLDSREFAQAQKLITG
jgi:hypothetical protein